MIGRLCPVEEHAKAEGEKKEARELCVSALDDARMKHEALVSKSSMEKETLRRASLDKLRHTPGG